LKKTALIIILRFVLLLPTSASALELGLHMDITWYNDSSIRAKSISCARSIGAKVSRNSFLWHLIEPTKGVYDWSIPDSVVNELLKAGIDPLFCIYGSPTWANEVPTSTNNYYLYVPSDEAQFGLWVKNYETFVKAAVNRYSGKVKKWELWNEQNECCFWLPRSKTADPYIRWFQTIQSAIKNIDPKAEVASGGLSAIQYTGKQFLTAMYAKNIFPDIVAIHPYSTTAPNDYQPGPEGNFGDIATIRKLMLKYGQGNKKLWVTEWGWSTSKITAQTQAEWLRISLDMLKNQYSYVSLATYFTDVDKPPDLNHGLFTMKFQPKPSAIVFKEFADSIKTSPPKKLHIIDK